MPQKNEWIPAITLGIICQTIVNKALFSSILLSGTITGILLLSTGPLFTYFFAVFFLKEKKSISMVISIALSFLGIFFILTTGNIVNGNQNTLGIVYGFVSGILFGLFPILIRYYMIKKLNVITILA